MIAKMFGFLPHWKLWYADQNSDFLLSFNIALPRNIPLLLFTDDKFHLLCFGGVWRKKNEWLPEAGIFNTVHQIETEPIRLFTANGGPVNPSYVLLSQVSHYSTYNCNMCR